MYKDIILILVLLLIVAGAGFYIYRAKKSGSHCVGCPHAKQCSGKSCGCGSTLKESTEGQ